VLVYYVLEDFMEEAQEAAPFTLLDRAIRAYRLVLSNRPKALRARCGEEYIDLVRCLPTHPHDPVGEDAMCLDFLDDPDWRSDRALKAAARMLADKLNIRYCLFRGCLLPAPVTDKLPRNLADMRLWPTVPGQPATAVRWVDVAGVGRLSAAEFRRRYLLTGSAFASQRAYPLVLRLTAYVRKPNGRCKTLKLLPWEFHLLACAGLESQ